jgi:hypothetical protein
MKNSKENLILAILESIHELEYLSEKHGHEHENSIHGEPKKKFHGKNLIFGSDDPEQAEILELGASLDETDEAVCEGCLVAYMNEHVGILQEAKYKGRKVPLGKPMRGDVKKSKVFVKDPKTGNVKKVNFGDPNMTIKKNNPARRKSFRARHKCSQKKDRTTAGYWSCRAWE